MSNRIIITVVGYDTVGIIAGVCNYLAKNNINILDISQTVIQEILNMMMIVDTSKSEKHFADIAVELEKLGKDGTIAKLAEKYEVANTAITDFSDQK